VYGDGVGEERYYIALGQGACGTDAKGSDAGSASVDRSSGEMDGGIAMTVWRWVAMGGALRRRV
jgi:hypothetical protein